jgi:pSer/pThr/pTyr-binding forkhead associated (FHA) protein
MAMLYRLSDNGSRTGRWEIGEAPIIVGRNGHAPVSIEDEGLSRRHFLIAREGEEYVLRDLNSRNGTWVDGRRILAEKLHHNDCFQAGRTRFLFAELPFDAARLNDHLTGPHGTVIVRAAPQPEPRLSAPRLWQEDAGGTNLEAAA